MTKDTYRDLLITELDRSQALRARAQEDEAFARRRSLLRDWQAGRLGRTHRDLLESPRFAAAAKFFLTDLYGPTDISRHVEDVRRIVPLMTRVLPDSGLAAVAHAVELNALSESLDGAMVEILGARIVFLDEASYGAAYRSVGRAEERARQIDLIELLGGALDTLTHIHLIGATLKMMRKPAQLAGLGALQAFLERGYSAFGAMRGGAGEFVSLVVSRERAISIAVLAGDDEALSRPPAAAG
ncbi:hypothetical protein DFR50_13826 [Roseiarcus fermentans]|uniref:DUF8198 domain-containing protein n=1 Tax=Roseiarcus fermentans TaxID=1473586 RepID=A0A366EQF0_9HYPH|nr:hypothetical protein [Roseiarcus fermentans]RBP04642.1 hypothetical protein DFR50_13826 [Roseiarcus fermentans]